MLMKVQAIDFHYVEARHHAIDQRLREWARYVAVRQPSWVHPMWRKGRSNGRQWEAPVIRDEINILRAHETEKAVSALPDMHRSAIRWCYVYRTSPAKVIRDLGTTYEKLDQLVRDGRTMLINRGVSA